ncbi:TPA: mRNA-degrading endonuclease [Candidatus Acetothermia bacterium]|nr:mRNA-degrading endonuclease [Candidatus Acetothermia bacterium]HAZ30634.1 mRNA-degrading endonuclease [Candidatus Acetothermia bacterium]
MAEYVPRQGDFILAVFDPRAGHEQSGRRPALVISRDLFNQRTGLAIVCPITSTKRDYPLHVAIRAGHKVTGFVMVEQVRAIDYRAREAKRIGKASQEVLAEALSLLDACIY